jgi:hypothetical protein
MNLAKRYARKDTKTLISVLEHPADYSAEALEAAEAELNFRELEEEVIYALVDEVNRERIVKMLNEFNPVNDELKLLKSHWLSESEMRRITKEEFKLLLDRKDGFRFDVLKYAIGGI